MHAEKINSNQYKNVKYPVCFSRLNSFAMRVCLPMKVNAYKCFNMLKLFISEILATKDVWFIMINTAYVYINCSQFPSNNNNI